MPKYCSVFGCNASSASSNESFFQYPAEPNTRRSWISRVRREGFKPTSTSYVCSRHFSADNFSETKNDTPGQFQRKRLERGAIPNVNLRGNETDERVAKRTSNVSRKALEPSIPNPLLSESKLDEEQLTEATFVSPEVEANVALTEEEKNFLEMKELKDELARAKEQISKLEKNMFNYKNLKDHEIQRYTGISKAVFNSLASLIQRFTPLNYWSGSSVTSVSIEDQLLILLMKLRLDLPYFDLARRFSLSQTTIQNIFMTYIHVLHELLFLGMLNKIPSLEKNKCSLPESFGSFSSCRIILDCTEFRVSVPRKDLEAASSSFSNYKHYLTGKFLVGVAPNGCITFVSEGFPGSTSDKIVTKESGIVHHFQAGDLILADKGFLIYDLLPKNVFLNLPAFLAGKTQLTKEEAAFSRKIASCRIHVERAIERMRNYKILHTITAPLRPFVNKIVQVCATLVDLQSPIIAGVLQNYAESPSISISSS